MLNCSQQTNLIFNGSFAQNLTASKLGWSPTPQALYSSIMWRDNVSTWITLTRSRTRSWVSDCGRSPRTKNAGFRTRSIRLWPPTWLIHRQAWTWWVHQCWIHRQHHLLKIPHVLLHFSMSFSIENLTHNRSQLIGSSSFYTVLSKSSNNVQRNPRCFWKRWWSTHLSILNVCNGMTRRRRKQWCRSNRDLSSRKSFRRWQRWTTTLGKHGSKNHQNCQQRESNKVLKIPLYAETQEIQEIHIRHNWTAESQTKLNSHCTHSADNFDFCLLCPNWTKLLPYGFFTLWLLRLDFTV